MTASKTTALILCGIILGLTVKLSPAAGPATNQPVRLVIVGDSTVCEYPTNSARRGWGMFIQSFFNSNELQVINLARSGRSTKTFIEEKRWTEALNEKPDFVLIQFGHNDSHSPDHHESTDASTDYQQYLRQYVDDSRAIGARPVLITPMCRRNFGTNGQVENELLRYADAMKKVATEKKVPLLDLNTASVRLCNQLGPEASSELANEPKDATHFNEKGAETMASLVMKELPEAEPVLKKYLK